MRLGSAVATLLALLPALHSARALGMSRRRRLELRDEVKESFYHAYNGYMDYAFPFDELNPVTCHGRGRDRANPSNINVNDVLGDYLLTLVDTLDSLAVLGDKRAFAKAVAKTIQFLPDFDVDSHVQVFEVTIRMLGGLLSAHIIATDEKDTLGMRLDKDGSYNGELLGLARDLAYRLLPAFEASPNGIPYPRTNLKYGFLRGETPETCAAGFGTLLLEFGTLSRLTNETIFEDVARQALNELWLARSKKNLFGNVYNLEQRKWVTPIASVSAGVDSLYEYLLKSYVYFGDAQYLQTFEASYSSLMRYVRDAVGGYAFYNVDMRTGEVASTWVDSLSAYFPGLMVLAGDVDGAESAYLLFYHLWRRYRAMPERFNMFLREADVVFYPLRPEFVESTYFLYRATRDPFYLDVGEMVLRDLNELQRTECGYASMQNVNTHVIEERMESFLLSETLKYLYLLFDDENPLHSADSNYVFTTEGHVLLPLSQPSNRSAQYPSKSSFAKRRLIHLESAPAAVDPLFYRIDNIRNKLAASHPDDMFAMPEMSAEIGIGEAAQAHVPRGGSRELGGDARKCPIPRSMVAELRQRDSGDGSNATQTLLRPRILELPNGMQVWFGARSSRAPSPLQQLGVQRELARAVAQTPRHLTKERQYLSSLVVNTATQTLSLRPDFYNIGVLANNGRHGATAAAGGRAGRSQELRASLQLGLESAAVCVEPLLQLELVERHNVWLKALYGELGEAADAYCVREPPSGADTWLAPNTRQMPFMNFLASRAEGRNIMAWDVPPAPRTRSGAPLLRDVWDEGQQHKEQQGTAHDPQRNMKRATRPKQRGYAASAAQQENSPTTRPLVVTNGVGQVLTDYVLVRLGTDGVLQEFVRALPVHNDSVNTMATAPSSPYMPTILAARSSSSSLPARDAHVHQGNQHRRRDFAGRLASFAEPALYRGHPPYLVPHPTTVIMLHLYSSSSAYGCEQYTPREQRMVKGKVVAVRHGGGCSMWDKALYAAKAGAQALLVDAVPTHSEDHDDPGPLIGTHFACDRRLCVLGKCLLEECPADSPLGVQPDDLHRRQYVEEPGQTSMPVVIVAEQVVNELEQYLISGLHVRAELL